MGETRVDLQHLLEDLRDAYTGALEETILTEVIANALDSGATRVRLSSSTAQATLTITDDGRGMLRRELARYHDVAASSKARGEGIGFAGVGIKLGLLLASEVLTETRRGATHVATRWHLASRHRAPWKWITPPGLVDARGTAVRLTLTNQLSPLLDSGYLEEAIRRHFEPLIDPALAAFLGRQYGHGVAFEVDGRSISAPDETRGERVPVAIRIGRRRAPSVVGFIERDAFLPPERQGIAISTFGKVIKRGWEWLGITPGSAALGGVIEVPELAASLTLSKNDFIRTGARGASYLAYRKAIQEVVARQLAVWGDSAAADSRPRAARLERDLERVLEDLADDFPLLQSLVDRRAGGQKRLPMPGRGHDRATAPLFARMADTDDDLASPVAGLATPTPHSPPASEEPAGEPSVETQAGREGQVKNPATPDVKRTAATDGEMAAGTVASSRGRRRPARYGLLVQFESRPNDFELARLVESTVWINDAHPAFTRALASRALGYHTALAVALALAPLAVEPAEEHGFVTQFLAHWGGTQPAARRSRRRVRKSA